MEDKRKRKVRFEDDERKELGREKTREPTNKTGSRLHSGQHTLDSDDDDEQQDETRHSDDDDDRTASRFDADGSFLLVAYGLDRRLFVSLVVEEPATISFDETVKITPFNLDEELEDGGFDQDGCFQWKKKNVGREARHRPICHGHLFKKDEIHDAWLDDIDWTNVNNYKLNKEKSELERVESRNDDDQPSSFDEPRTIESMLALMVRGETVSQAIRRLGKTLSNNSGWDLFARLAGCQGRTTVLLSFSQPSKRKKTTADGNNSNQLEQTRTDKESLDKLTSLADRFVSNGNFDIYQTRFEELAEKLDEDRRRPSSRPSFDMFDDGHPVSDSIGTGGAADPTADLLWEFVDENETTVRGRTTEQMIEFKATLNGKAMERVRCRRENTEQFYSIRRIDFELYLD